MSAEKRWLFVSYTWTHRGGTAGYSNGKFEVDGPLTMATLRKFEDKIKTCLAYFSVTVISWGWLEGEADGTEQTEEE